MDLKIIEVNQKNIDEYVPVCFLNPKNKGYQLKRDWLLERFSHGLKIKVLRDESKNKNHGYIEYIPGEQAFRAVEAKGYMFIHCIWVTPNNLKNKGYGSLLIKECLKDSKEKLGVCAITSDDAFMAAKDVFVQNGFKVKDQSGKQQLVVKTDQTELLPKIKNNSDVLKDLKGWHLIYSNQCPWVARFVDELDQNTISKLNLTVTQIKTAQQAQNAPSVYAVFNLIHNGKILADHYISATRFKNIIKKHA